MAAAAASESASSMRDGRSPVERLDQDTLCDAPAERDLHPVNVDEQWAVEGASAGHSDGVADVEAEVVQPAVQRDPPADVEDARFKPWVQLIERHRTQ